MGTFDCERLYMEFWDVPEESAAEWLDYYDNVIIKTLRHVNGYGGSMIFRQTPPYGGGVERVINNHWGIRTLGARTNASINLGALLQHEYTYMVLLFMREFNPEIMPEFFDGFKAAVADWREKYPGWEDDPGADWLDAAYLAKYFETGSNREDAKRIVDLMSRDFFSLSGNHWDMSYDMVMSRFPWDPTADADA